MIERIIFKAYSRHCALDVSGRRTGVMHSDGYDVCGDLLCRVAYWLERVFRREWSEL